MTDNANLLDIIESGKLRRFLRKFMGVSAALMKGLGKTGLLH